MRPVESNEKTQVFSDTGVEPFHKPLQFVEIEWHEVRGPRNPPFNKLHQNLGALTLYLLIWGVWPFHSTGFTQSYNASSQWATATGIDHTRAL